MFFVRSLFTYLFWHCKTFSICPFASFAKAILLLQFCTAISISCRIPIELFLVIFLRLAITSLNRLTDIPVFSKTEDLFLIVVHFIRYCDSSSLIGLPKCLSSNSIFVVILLISSPLVCEFEPDTYALCWGFHVFNPLVTNMSKNIFCDLQTRYVIIRTFASCLIALQTYKHYSNSQTLFYPYIVKCLLILD